MAGLCPNRREWQEEAQSSKLKVQEKLQAQRANLRNQSAWATERGIHSRFL
jgi:hypothetical protein